MATKKLTVAQVRREVERHLAEISELFVDTVEFTFVARNKALDDSDLVVTTEDALPPVIDALGRLAAKEARRGR